MSEPLNELDKKYPRQTSDEVLPPPSRRDREGDVEQPVEEPTVEEQPIEEQTIEEPLPAGDATEPEPTEAEPPLSQEEDAGTSSAGTGSLDGDAGAPTIERPDSVLAIVVIHGMGTSKPGDMLERYMNASLEWIKRATTEDHNRYVFNHTDENLVRGVNRLERNRARDDAPKNTSSTLPTDIVQVDVESLSAAVLQSADNRMHSYQPPYIEFELSQRERDKNTTIIHKVVAVEAWWDSEFEPPTFRDVAYWALGVAPNLILRHLALMWTASDGEDATTVSLTHETDELEKLKQSSSNATSEGDDTTTASLTQETNQLQQSTSTSTEEGEDTEAVYLTPKAEKQKELPASTNPKGSIWRRIVHNFTALTWNIFGSLAAVMVQWFVCILLVLGAIPFLQKYVRSIILSLTSSFGDVLIYVHDGVRSAAIRSAVERSFQWVFDTYKAENQKLIVMAHSLGSVIAYDVLNHRDFHKIQSKKPSDSSSEDSSEDSAGEPSKSSSEDSSENSSASTREREVSLITFGSPLKKANILLQLKRDEQRVSLGIIFAFFSLLMAILALTSQVQPDFGWKAMDFAWPQYLFVIAIAVATLSLGIGAHMPPRMSGLSALQIAGSVSAAIALVLLLVMLSVEKRFVWFAIVGVLGLAACIYWRGQWLKKVQESRKNFIHDRQRVSQSLVGEWILLGLVLAAGASTFLTPVALFLLGSLIFSAMSASNPLEEFELEGKSYVRRPPLFHFQTKLTRWIDFWATRDLVSEFGLGEVKYRTDPEGEFGKPVHSRRVTNFHSLLRDHTSFVSNVEQFIAPVTRFFLEQLNVREPIPQESYGGPPRGNLWASVKISRDYEQDMSRAMRVREARVRWLNFAAVPLVVLLLLLGPGVYRSLGEFIVFDQAGITADDKRVAGFYNPEPLLCNEKCSNIRTLPVLADDISINLIRNDVTRNIILFGLGYGIAAVVLFVLRNILLNSSWTIWESAILDTIVQRRTKTSKNLQTRRAAFFLFAAVFLVCAVAINIPWVLENLPWLDLVWIPDTGNAPAQTVVRFIDWMIDPLDWHLVDKLCNEKQQYICFIDQ